MNLKKIKEYSNPSFYIKSELTRQFRKMFCFNDLLYISIIDTTAPNIFKQGGILILDKNLNEVKVVQLYRILVNKGFAKDNNLLEFNNIYFYKGRTLINIDEKLFFIDKECNEWETLFKVPTINKEIYFKHNNKNSVFIPKTIEVNNDDIFEGYQRDNDSLNIFDFWYSFSIYSVQNFGLVKYSQATDSVEYFNSIWNNMHFTRATPISTYDGFFYRNIYKDEDGTPDLIVLEDSIFVFANVNKSIIQSRDNAKSWELINYFSNGSPLFLLNDSMVYCISNSLELLYSTNSGKNFYPPIIDNSNNFHNFSQPNLFYIDENGNGFFTGAMKGNINVNISNFAITSDFGKSYKFKTDKFNFQYEFAPNYSNTLKISDNVYFYANYNKDSCKLYSFNVKDLSLHALRKDTALTFHYLCGDNINSLISFATSRPTDSSLQKNFFIMKYSDSAFSWKPLIETQELQNLNQFFNYNKDTVLFTSINPSRAFLYDIKSNKIDTIYIGLNKNSSNIQFFKIEDRLYLVGDSLFLFNTDRNDLTKWKSEKWDYGVPSFNNVLSLNNTIIAILSDSIRKKIRIF